MTGAGMLAQGQTERWLDTGNGRWPVVPDAPGLWTDQRAQRSIRVRWLAGDEADLSQVPQERGRAGDRPPEGQEPEPPKRFGLLLLGLAGLATLLESRLEVL